MDEGTMTPKDIEKELKKRKIKLLKREGFSITENKIYMTEDCYCFCMATCGTVTLKINDILFQSEYLSTPGDVVDALLLGIK